MTPEMQKTYELMNNVCVKNFLALVKSVPNQFAVLLSKEVMSQICAVGVTLMADHFKKKVKINLLT